MQELEDRIEHLESELEQFTHSMETITKHMLGLTLTETTYVVQAQLANELREQLKIIGPSAKVRGISVGSYNRHLQKMRAKTKERKRITSLC